MRKPSVFAAALFAAALYPFAPASAQPANDQFASATPISGASGSAPGTAVDATADPGEPSNHPGWLLPDDLFGHSIWFTWTAPSDVGPTTFMAVNPPFECYTSLGIYTGSAVEALTEVGFNLYSPVEMNWSTSRVDFTPTPGSTYVLGAGSACGAELNLSWAPLGTPPANDDFADAPELSAEQTGSTLEATWEPDEPGGYFENSVSDLGGRGVWYTYTPTETKRRDLSLSGSSYDTVLAVYKGSFGALTLVAFNDDSDGLQSAVRFVAEAGITYSIGVGGCCGMNVEGGQVVEWGDSGTYVLSLTDAPVTVPDAPAQPSATPGNGQVALSWTAPFNGNSEITGYTVAFKGTEDTEWTTVSPTTATSLTVFPVTNGVLYEFRVRATNAFGDSEWSPVRTAMPFNTGITLTSAVLAKGVLSVTFGSTGAPPLTEFQCSLDDRPWVTCTPPTWTVKPKGGKTVNVQGRVDATSAWLSASRVIRQR